jgi:signal transduction histidine kinase/ligand-binding sensor domain-containing protein
MALLCFVGAAHGLDPNRLTTQYARQQWSVGSEFPWGSVNAIGQTADGYLWIGTDKGLIRFDGFDFRPVSFHSLVANPNTQVLGLTTDSEGNLLVRLQGAGMLRRRNGNFENLETAPNPFASQVTAMWRNPNGDVLLSDLENGTLRLSNEKVAAAFSGPGLPAVISLAQTPNGKIWVGTLSAGLLASTGGQPPTPMPGLPAQKINCLLPVSDDELWVGTDQGAFRWNGSRFIPVQLPSPLRGLQILTMLRDRDANVWIGTAQGLLRINAAGTSFSNENEVRGNGGVRALFEDREGNLWVGGARGVERIRDSAFVTYSEAPGLASEFSGPVYVDLENRTWFAPADGGLYWMKDGRVRAVKNDGLDKDVVYSISGSGRGIWIGRQHGGLTHLQISPAGVTAQTYTAANGLAQDSVYSTYESRDGSVWAGTLSGGVSRFKNGRFLTYTTQNGLASNTVSSVLQTRDGTTWLATPNGLSSFSRDVWRTYNTKDGLPSENVNCLFEDATGSLWIGTSKGLALYSSEKLHQLGKVPDSLRDEIFGIAEDKNGWLWITAANHILRVRRDKLSSGTLDAADVREYGLADGLRSIEGVNRNSSVVADSQGKIWFSTGRGLSVVDPSHLKDEPAPAIPHVEAISADGNTIEMGSSIRVPASPRRITISYTGLSLAVPERVRFRYFLEGFDHNWSEPVAAREAVYTNLGPGLYRFRVISSNSDGLWNGTGSEAAMSFEVAPAFWQTWWFQAATVIIVALTALLWYRLRLRQLTRQMNVRFEERLAERTRIAQELHDTLLQGFLSASMQLHVADERLSTDSPAKPLVTRVLDLMRNVIDDGRNTVRDLRSASTNPGDLERAFSRIPEELGIPPAGDFRVIVEGQSRPLHPAIRDDVYRIGREALVNSFRHARASSIEVELEYGVKEMRLVVRDNGDGIDPQVLRQGRDGHWGLPGMRERAQRIGAQFRVWSRPAGGTEVELSVPASIAFESKVPGRAANWLTKLYAREKESNRSDINKRAG